VEVAVVEADIIDSINILQASLLAMRQALSALSVRPDLVLIDGNKQANSGFSERAIVKGDNLSASIMAASIIAKVTRDHIMREAHELYPVYGFHAHKGYGCPEHLEALQKHGPCPLHRRSFDPVRALAV
jgi:ribonuclease HII